LLAGVMDLYEATLEPRHLDFALNLAGSMIARFYDSAQGGFWQSPPGAADLILRVKEDYDGAEPAGNSVATLALLRLAAITGRSDLQQKAEESLRCFAQRLEQMPVALPAMLLAVDFWLEEPKRVVIVEISRAAGTRALLQAAHSVYQPNKVVLGQTGLVEPFVKTLSPKDGQPTAYLCAGTACQPPTHDPEKLKEMLTH